jgi:competence protein ComEC
MLGENSGAEEAELALLSEAPGARCSPDLCLVEVQAGARRWRVLATRSGYLVPWPEMIAACRIVDVVVSERRLPPGCTPHWLKLDRDALAKTGGVAIRFGNAEVRTARAGGSHPWLDPLSVQPPYVAPDRSDSSARRARRARE